LTNQKVKFLFIHYHYPPIKNSGIYRNYYLSSAIAQKLPQSWVLTSDNRKVLPNESMDVSENLYRLEIPTFDYRTVFALLSREKKFAGAQFKESSKKNAFLQWLIKIQRSFPFNIFLAEGSILYIICGYRKGKNLITQNNITVIYSSFMPYADHIIAYLLKHRFPEKIWVADFRDLHIEPIYKNTIWIPIQRWFEKKILSKADLITTVSEGISKKLEIYDRPIFTIAKGVSVRPIKKQFQKFTISYSGSLFLHYRDPKVLIVALHKLIKSKDIESKDINFIYAGKDSNQMRKWVEESGISDIFIDKGYLSRQASIEIQDKSHINLLLTSSSPDHQGLLTGKMFEYFEAQNQILCIIKGVYDSEIEGIFSSLQAGKIVYDPPIETDKLESFILDKYHEWQNTGEVKSTINHKKLVEEYGWDVQADKLLDAIESAKI